MLLRAFWTTAVAASLAAAQASNSNSSASNPLLVTPAPAESVDTSLNLTSGGYFNALYRSNLTAAQVLFTEPSAVDAAKQPNRFLVALPAGNSGSVLYWYPLTNATANATANELAASPPTTAAGAGNLSVTLENGTLTSAIGPNKLTGVQGTMLFSSSAVLGPAQVGSVRQVRDYIEGSGLSHQVFNFTVSQLDSSVVWFSRQWINETVITLPNGTVGAARYGYELRLQAQNGTASFQVTPGNNGTFTPPSVQVIVPEGQVGKIDFTVQTNETSLVPLAKADIFANATPEDAAAVGGFNLNETDAFRSQMSFLLYGSKATAGGWRFLTYFGRDTLFTLRLLMSTKTLSPLAIESILGGVIERINGSSGYVCHEETIGDYASFVNMGNNKSYLGNTPFLDYKMTDTHALLLPQLADYLLLYNGTFDAAANASAQQFLNRTSSLANGTRYADLLSANVGYLLNSSRAFAENPIYANLAANQAGIPVGNWRDSNEGLGYGTRAFDVNTALWPAALYAIADLAAAGILNPSLQQDARKYAQTWETKSLDLFRSEINPADANALLSDYVQRTNLTDALLYGDGLLNATVAPEEPVNGTTTTMQPRTSWVLPRQEAVPAGAGAGAAPPSNGSSVTAIYNDTKVLYGLSLRENGSVVNVLHSDLGFGLVFRRNISRSYVTAVIEALQPFPRGLLTNVGMLVSNPAYDVNRTNIDVLGRSAYHGTVSWSWQSGIMALGLRRVLAVFTTDTNNTSPVLTRGLERAEWCDDAQLISQLRDAQTNLVRSINGARDEIFAEVWSWTLRNSTATTTSTPPAAAAFEVTPLGALSSGTESDAVQLWSFGALNGATTTTAAANRTAMP